MVADAGMLSEANLAAIEDAGLRFIVGARIPECPTRSSEMARRLPATDRRRADVRQPWVMGPRPIRGQRTIFYQYRADRARRTLKGDRSADRQGREGGRRAGGGEAEPVRPAHRRHQAINRSLEAKARALAGLKGYVTNLEAPTAEYVIGAYHQLWQIEKSFRMSKTDLAPGRSTTTNATRSRPTSPS